MGDYCKDMLRRYKKGFKRFINQYSDDSNKCIENITGFSEKHAAYRYLKIHGAVLRMGGFANFSHYVNRCADNDYEIFRKLEAENEELRAILNLKQPKSQRKMTRLTARRWRFTGARCPECGGSIIEHSQLECSELRCNYIGSGVEGIDSLIDTSVLPTHEDKTKPIDEWTKDYFSDLKYELENHISEFVDDPEDASSLLRLVFISLREELNNEL